MINTTITISNNGTQNMTINNKITGKLSSITTSDADGNITGLDNLGNVQLGDIGNVHIDGGNLGQFLQTDGNGNLNWGDSPSPVSIENGTSNVAVAPSGNVTVGVAGTANVVVVEAATVIVNGNIIPGANTTFSLGNSTNWFTDLWLGANTLRVGGLPLSTANGELFFNGTEVIQAGTPATGNIETSGNIIANNASITDILTANTVNANGVVTADSIVANTTITADTITVEGADLGAVGNITITGGSNGQVLQTDGTGNLSFGTIDVGVESFNTRTGNVTLESSDVITAMGYTPAPLVSPAFTGTPTAPTVANVEDSTGNIATTGFVQGAVATVATRVVTFEGRSGNVILANTDIANAGGALLDSPTFVGSPSGPTPTLGDSSTRFATTEFVTVEIANVDVGVSSFEGRTGGVTLEASDVANALGYIAAPIENPSFIGTVIAPTPAQGTDDQQVATTEFVTDAISNVPLTPPGGANFELQYNNDGQFAGTAAFSVDPTAGNMTVTGNMAIGANATVTGSLCAGATRVTSLCSTGGASITGGALNMNNRAITNVDSLTIADPGPNEGISWAGGNLWRIVESPDNLTNTGGNLQIIQNTTRRATFNTDGQIDIPVVTGTAPLKINSTTRVANLNVDCAASADSSAIADVANNVRRNDQPNITSVGTLVDLTVTGNTTIGGDLGAANATLGNTAAANFFIGDGGLLSNINVGNIIGAYGNDDVANYLPTYTGDLGNVTDITANSITATLFTGNGAGLTDIAFAEAANTANLAVFSEAANTANIASLANSAVSVEGGNVSGQVANALIAAQVYDNAQPNITSVGTLISLAVTSDITAGNITVTGAVTGDSVVANTVAGSLTTAAQPNITSVGTLVDLTVTGNVAAGNISATNVTGTLTTNAQPNITEVGTLDDLAVTGNTVTGNLEVTGTVTLGNVELDNITANSANISNVLVANGNVTNVTALEANSVAVTGNITGACAACACFFKVSSFSGSAGIVVIDAGGKSIGGVNALCIADPGPGEGIVFGSGSGWNVTEAPDTLDNAAGNIQFILNGNRAATVTTLGQLSAAAANGTAPLLVDSCTQVANLNATLLQGRNIASARTPTTVVVRDSSGGFAAVAVAANTITANDDLVSQGNAAITGDLTANNVTVAETVTANALAANTVTADDITASNLATFTDVIATTITASTDDITISATGADNDVVLVPTGNGAVSVSSKRIIDLATPVADTDAATKLYVDSNSQGLDVKASVSYATVAGLGAYTYNNGTSGVGATITSTDNEELSVDGSTPSVGDRILVKDEIGANAPYNGIYVVTQVGVAAFDGSPFILTRATDFDAADEIPGAFTFVTGGSTLANSGWVASATTPVTVGTTDITFTQFSAAGNYQAGNGLTLTGEVFSVNVDNISTGITAGNVVVRSGATLTNPNITSACGVCLCLSGAANVATLCSRGAVNIGGTLNMTGASITNVNALTIQDPGQNEGINWAGGNLWRIFESPDNFTNTGGNLQFVQDTTRRATFNTDGQLDLPVGTGTAPLVINSTTRVANLNVDCAASADSANIANVANSVAAANITGQVANALVAGTVYTNAQPNITSVGTLTSLAVTGNVTAGNISGANRITANFITGTLTTAAQPNVTSVGTLTSLNVTGNINAANVNATRLCGSLITAAQPNVTSVGTLTSLNVTGNIVSGNANLGNAVRANFFIGDGGLLSNISGGSGSYGDANVANYLPNYTGNMNCINTVNANRFTNGANSVRIGVNSGLTSQASFSVAIGCNAGCFDQGGCSIAIGVGAGCVSQSAKTVAVGTLAGCLNQSFQGTAVGDFSGAQNQGCAATAVGAAAGCLFQGQYGVALGYRAGSCCQLACTIVINATGCDYNPTFATPGLFIKPVATSLNKFHPILQYNTSTGEISSSSCVISMQCIQSNVISANTFSVGTFTTTNITASGNITATGNITGNRITGTLLTACQPNITCIGTLTDLCVTCIACVGRMIPVSGGVKIGFASGTTSQCSNTVAIGTSAGQQCQGLNAVAIGLQAGCINQGFDVVAIGTCAGFCNQSTESIAIGRCAGASSSFCGTVSIGGCAGYFNQRLFGVAIGKSAGVTSQGCCAISIGLLSGCLNQGVAAVAVGPGAGASCQGIYSVAIGESAGGICQDACAIAIGPWAGRFCQGINSIAIGAAAGNGAAANNTIILNATGANLNNTTANSFVVKPVRNATGTSVAQYNATTGEISYSTTVPGTLSTAAQPNITSVGTLTSLDVTGTVSGGLFTGNGAGLSCIAYANVAGAYSNANVASYLPTYMGELTANRVCAVQLVGTVLTGVAPLVVSSTTRVANLNADLLDGYNSSITNVANTVVVRGAGGCFSAGVITATLNGGACRAVNVTASAQPNITSVGTLTDLSVTGNVTSGNLSTGFLTATGANLGNITSLTILGGANGQSIVTDGSGVLTWGSPSAIPAAAGANTEIQYNLNGVVAGSANLTFDGVTTTTRCLNVLSGMTVSGGALNMNNRDIQNVNNITISDPGPNEGVTWQGGNCWKIYESPDDLSNAGGNLQIVQNTTRRATFNTNGQIDIAATTGTAPLIVCSNTLVANLNAETLQGFAPSTFNTSNTIAVRGASGLLCSTTFCGSQVRTNTAVFGGTTNITGTQLQTTGCVLAGNLRLTCEANIGGQLCVGNGIIVGRSLGTNYNFNTVLGCCAGQALTGASTGANLEIIGHCAGQNVSTGRSSTVIGATALRNSTTVCDSTAIGFAVACCRTSTIDEMYIGIGAGIFSSNNSQYNTGVGHNTLGASNGCWNTAVGYSAGQIACGIRNTIVGSFAGAKMVGCNSVAIGDRALCSTGFACSVSSVLVGHAVQFGLCQPLSINTVAIGDAAIEATGCVCNTIAIGQRAAAGRASALNSVILGHCAASGGSGNGVNGIVSIGWSTMKNYIGGGGAPIAIGLHAFCQASMLDYSVGIGSEVGSCLSGQVIQSTAVGALSQRYGLTGCNNTSVGYLALSGISTNFGPLGCDNTAVGWGSGSSMAGGCFNTFVGSQTGMCFFVGTENTVIGACTGCAMNGSSRTINIGNCNLFLFGRCSFNGIFIGRILSPGGVGNNNETVIGCNLTGKGTDTTFIGGSFGIYNQRNVTTWNTVSDRRIKKEIVDNVTGLDVIDSIRVRDFQYKSDEEMPVSDNNIKLATGLPQDKTVTGVIAQELQEVLPRAVDESPTGVLSVNTDPIFWALVNAVKELSAEVKELKRRLDER